MLYSLALITTLLTGLYLLALAIVSLLKPAKVSNFLLGFATSAPVHYLELLIRIVVGAAFVIHAPLMKFTNIFTIFGWILIGTTACLFVVPWQWHQRFAQRAVPYALRYLKLLAVCSLILGSFIIICAVA
jgi:uncharacterized membrane protein YedE/YeeE